MKFVQLSLFVSLFVPATGTAQNTTDYEELSQAVVKVFKDSVIYNGTARRHHMAIEGCEQYVALRLDILRDNLFENRQVKLDTCLYVVRETDLFFYDMKEYVALEKFKIKQHKYLLWLRVYGEYMSTTEMTIKARVRRSDDGLQIERIDTIFQRYKLKKTRKHKARLR